MKNKKNLRLAYLFQGQELYDLSDQESTERVDVSTMQKENLIICKKEELDDPQLKGFLEKILGSINLSNDEIVQLGVKDEVIPLHILKRSVNPVNVLLFGIPVSQIALYIEANSYQWSILSNCHILLTDGLNELNRDKRKKQQLWIALQKRFKTKS